MAQLYGTCHDDDQWALGMCRLAQLILENIATINMSSWHDASSRASSFKFGHVTNFSASYWYIHT